MLLSRDKKWKKKNAVDPEVIITNAVPVREPTTQARFVCAFGRCALTLR